MRCLSGLKLVQIQFGQDPVNVQVEAFLSVSSIDPIQVFLHQGDERRAHGLILGRLPGGHAL